MNSLRLLAVPALASLLFPGGALAQSEAAPAKSDYQRLVDEVKQLRAIIAQQNQRIGALEARESPPPSNLSASATTPNQGTSAEAVTNLAQTSKQAISAVPEKKSFDPLDGATINLTLDGYYAYNFNHPVGRVSLLHAYDVLSNNFSLNQASIIFEKAPDLAAGRRFGTRLDLQFGQATDTLQGNPANEPRPQIFRNIFQAYGTYVLPVSSGLTVDFGKWASALGIENNYTKDQMNYSRSYFFNFLPFYHMGVRATYKVNDHLALNYWLVNGTNQAEATNGFKDELFGFTATPRKTVSWTMNYYLGQENPDRVVVVPSSPVPVQPGLSFQAIRPAPDGRLHIFDSYVTWQTTPKVTLAAEGDYVIQRMWRNASLGRSSVPAHVAGGAAYARYELAPKVALAGRAEYLSDHGGLFSGITQALKETTLTFDYKLADGFLMRYEWRRDFSNRPSFLTDVQGVLNKQQNVATLGLIWWWGRKEGAW